MKITLLVLASLFISFEILAQNLVPNASFEDYSSCPNTGYINTCNYWINCGNTPDYDNSCRTPGSPFWVPQNFFGYQNAASGNAYCDLWTFASNELYREYIGVPLIAPMEVGHTYRVSFKCSPGVTNGYSLQSNKIGIRFSTIAYDSINAAPTDNFAHIYTDNIVSDTLNWTTISGYFTADSAYSFLVIGNFFDDLHTDTVSLSFCDTCANYFAVYYIDDVEVTDTTVNVEELNRNDFSAWYHNGIISFISGSPIRKIEIYNVIGQLAISPIYINTRQLGMFVTSLSNGVYVLHVQADKEKIIKILIY